MKIRTANRFDIPKIADMLRNYLNAGTIPNLKVEDETTALKILTHILIGGGLAIVSEKDNKLTGMLLAVRTPFLWDNTQFVMNEIAYWVEQEHRGSTAGYRLISEYVKSCDEMIENKKIMNYTISQMEGQQLKYERFGFRPIEHTWSI